MQEFNLINKLDEIGMFYFVKVSLFSAEALVDVIKAPQILNDNLEERSNNGTLRKAALGYYINKKRPMHLYTDLSYL